MYIPDIKHIKNLHNYQQLKDFFAKLVMTRCTYTK